MRKRAASERMGKGVPRRGPRKEMRRCAFVWALRNSSALRVEAMGSDKGGEVNRAQRIILKTTGSH